MQFAINLSGNLIEISTLYKCSALLKKNTVLVIDHNLINLWGCMKFAQVLKFKQCLTMKSHQQFVFTTKTPFTCIKRTDLSSKLTFYNTCRKQNNFKNEFFFLNTNTIYTKTFISHHTLQKL